MSKEIIYPDNEYITTENHTKVWLHLNNWIWTYKNNPIYNFRFQGFKPINNNSDSTESNRIPPNTARVQLI